MRTLLKNTTIAIVAAILLTASSALAAWEDGIAAFKAGNHALALQEFKAVVDQQPEWPGGQYMLGQTYLKLKRNKEAVAHLAKAVELDTGNSRYRLVLGKAYVDTRQYANATKAFQPVNPSGLSKAQQVAFHQMLAVAYERSGQSERAVESFSKAAAANPNDAEVQFQYGTAALKAGQTQTSISALEKASRLASNPAKDKVYIQALIRRARETRGEEKLGNYRKAVAAAQKLVGRQASYEHLLLLGETQLGAKQYSSSSVTLEKASAKSTTDWYASYYLGQAYAASGKYSSAEAALKKSLQRTSSATNQNRIWSQLGFVYEKEKKYGPAKDAYRRAGNSAAVGRVQKNEDTANFNADVEAEKRQIDELKAEQAALEKEIEEMGGAPPR